MLSYLGHVGCWSTVKAELLALREGLRKAVCLNLHGLLVKVICNVSFIEFQVVVSPLLDVVELWKRWYVFSEKSRFFPLPYEVVDAFLFFIFYDAKFEVVDALVREGVSHEFLSYDSFVISWCDYSVWFFLSCIFFMGACLSVYSSRTAKLLLVRITI